GGTGCAGKGVCVRLSRPFADAGLAFWISHDTGAGRHAHCHCVYFVANARVLSIAPFPCSLNERQSVGQTELIRVSSRNSCQPLRRGGPEAGAPSLYLRSSVFTAVKFLVHLTVLPFHSHHADRDFGFNFNRQDYLDPCPGETRRAREIWTQNTLDGRTGTFA